jgi:hypothetical protein
MKSNKRSVIPTGILGPALQREMVLKRIMGRLHVPKINRLPLVGAEHTMTQGRFLGSRHEEEAERGRNGKNR